MHDDRRRRHDLLDDVELITPLRATRWVGIDKDTWKRAGGYTESGGARGSALALRDRGARLQVQYERSGGLDRTRAAVASRGDERSPCSGDRAIHRRHQGAPHDQAAVALCGGAQLLPDVGIRTQKRRDLITFLKKRGIATGVHYLPLPLHPLFKSHKEAIPVALREWTTLVTLPLFADIEDAEIDYVLEGLRDFDRAL